MNLKELYTGNRTYRKFRQESIPEEDLKSIMENVRLSHCGNNRQRLKFIVVRTPELCGEIARQVHYAASLPREIGQPKKEEEAMAYIIVIRPKENYATADIDVGIAADVICASAWEKGIGSCMMMNFNVTKVNELLEIPEEETVRLVISMGYPAHKSTVVDLPADGNTSYYVDEDVNYYVPKRPLSGFVTFR